MEDFRAIIINTVSEKAFQVQIVRLAKLRDWLVYYTWRSKHSPAGFPDLVLVKGRRLLFVECKREKGKLTPDQEIWIDALKETSCCKVFLWRPGDWPQIIEILT